MFSRWLLILAFLTLLGCTAPPAVAEPCTGDTQIYGEDFVLPTGEALPCNLLVIGGDAIIEAGAVVPGSVVVNGGNLDLAGEIGADVTLFNGQLTLRRTAYVHGQLTTVFSRLTREAGAIVEGQDAQLGGNELSPLAPVADLMGKMLWVFISATGAGLLALLAALFWPARLQNTAQTLVAAPGVAWLLGLVILLLTGVAVVGLVLTLCLSPVAIALAAVVAGAQLFGWLALGQAVGARLWATAQRPDLSPAVGAAVGTFCLSLFAFGVSEFVPCGGVLPWLLGTLSFGAVVITRFGAAAYAPVPR